MKPSFTSLLLLVVLFFFGGLAQAEKADRDKPMNIEADAMRYDDLNQTSVWTGRVLLNKGTLQIRADRLDVREDAQGYQYGVATALGGKRAFYRQKREGVDEFIEGEGEVIEYDGRADIVKFIKKAQLRRYRGATLADDMNGALIVYNNTTNIFTVDGGPARVLPPRQAAECAQCSRPSGTRWPRPPPPQHLLHQYPCCVLLPP